MCGVDAWFNDTIRALQHCAEEMEKYRRRIKRAMEARSFYEPDKRIQAGPPPESPEVVMSWAVNDLKRRLRQYPVRHGHDHWWLSRNHEFSAPQGCRSLASVVTHAGLPSGQSCRSRRCGWVCLDAVGVRLFRYTHKQGAHFLPSSPMSGAKLA